MRRLSGGAGLGRNRRGGRGDCLGVAHVVRRDDLEPIVELVAAGRAGRDVDVGDVVVGDILEMLQTARANELPCAVTNTFIPAISCGATTSYQ